DREVAAGRRPRREAKLGPRRAPVPRLEEPASGGAQVPGPGVDVLRLSRMRNQGVDDEVPARDPRMQQAPGCAAARGLVDLAVGRAKIDNVGVARVDEQRSDV